MPRSNNRKHTKLHCSTCGKKRLMLSFWAIDPAAKSENGKPLALPFNLRRFTERMESNSLFKLPPFYAAMCSCCKQITYYRGHNHAKTMEVIIT